MEKIQATKKEVLLAIAMSGFYQTTHVHYMPIGKQYTNMLMRLRAGGYVEPMMENFYKLTKKGREYLVRQDVLDVQDIDNQIDAFIEKL